LIAAAGHWNTRKLYIQAYSHPDEREPQLGIEQDKGRFGPPTKTHKEKMKLTKGPTRPSQRSKRPTQIHKNGPKEKKTQQSVELNAMLA
jgi:hypothetical protein